MSSHHLYVHWPFCRRVCPYCDFNVRKNTPEMIPALSQALIADLEAEYALRGAKHKLASIHFGGGSPSLMPPVLIAEIIETATRLWPTDEGLQIALEANPEDRAVFADLHLAGINRLTLGLQSLSDQRLLALGRAHSRNDALETIESARAQFPSLAADFIYGTSGQTPLEWKAELDEITALSLDHLSLYSLTIEPKTVFGKLPPPHLPNNDRLADMMEMGEQMLNAKGYPQYEVSNFAQPKHYSAYNLGVWHSEDFIGIGPGAYGRFCDTEHIRQDLRKICRPKDYAENPQPDYLMAQETLDLEAALGEWLIMGLRLNSGISLEKPPQFLPIQFPMPNTIPTLQDLIADQMLKVSHAQLSATNQGRMHLDRLAQQVYAALEPYLQTGTIRPADHARS